MKSDLTLDITRVFDAPCRRVYQAWTDQEDLAKWSAPKDFTLEDYGGHVRPGGPWHCAMTSPKGEQFRVRGTYSKVEKNQRLVFTHTWDEEGEPEHETTVTVRFAEAGEKTQMHFHQETFKSKESRDGHEGGWTECFDKLKALLAVED